MSELLKSLYDEMNRAVFRESSVREASFLGLTTSICGVPVRFLTPYKYMMLDFINSPFIKGGECDDSTMINHIYKFIWLVSTDFKENDALAYDTFIKDKCDNLDFIKAIADISDYLTDMFLDSPPYKGERGTKGYIPSYYAWIVSYIDTLASEYGWEWQTIMDMPMPVILQFHNAIFARNESKAGRTPILINNISDPVMARIKSEHLRIKKEKEASNG